MVVAVKTWEDSFTFVPDALRIFAVSSSGGFQHRFTEDTEEITVAETAKTKTPSLEELLFADFVPDSGIGQVAAFEARPYISLQQTPQTTTQPFDSVSILPQSQYNSSQLPFSYTGNYSPATLTTTTHNVYQTSSSDYSQTVLEEQGYEATQLTYTFAVEDSYLWGGLQTISYTSQTQSLVVRNEIPSLDIAERFYETTPFVNVPSFEPITFRVYDPLPTLDTFVPTFHSYEFTNINQDRLKTVTNNTYQPEMLTIPTISFEKEETKEKETYVAEPYVVQTPFVSTKTATLASLIETPDVLFSSYQEKPEEFPFDYTPSFDFETFEPMDMQIVSVLPNHSYQPIDFTYETQESEERSEIEEQKEANTRESISLDALLVAIPVVLEQANQVSENVSDYLQEKVSEIKEKTRETVFGVYETLQKTSQEIKQTATRTYEHLEEALTTVKENVQESYGAVQKKVTRTYQTVKNVVQDVSRTVRSVASSLYQLATSFASETYTSFKDRFKSDSTLEEALEKTEVSVPIPFVSVEEQVYFDNISEVHKKIDAEANVDSTIFAVKNLNTGNYHGINDDEDKDFGSAPKLALVIGALYLAEQGKLDLEKEVEGGKRDLVNGPERFNGTVGELVEHGFENYHADFLLEHMRGEGLDIHEALAEMGYNHTRLAGYSQKTYKNNTTRASELVQMAEDLLTNNILSDENRDLVKSMMKNTSPMRYFNREGEEWIKIGNSDVTLGVVGRYQVEGQDMIAAVALSGSQEQLTTENYRSFNKTGMHHYNLLMQGLRTIGQGY